MFFSFVTLVHVRFRFPLVVVEVVLQPLHGVPQHEVDDGGDELEEDGKDSESNLQVILSGGFPPSELWCCLVQCRRDSQAQDT